MLIKIQNDSQSYNNGSHLSLRKRTGLILNLFGVHESSVHSREFFIYFICTFTYTETN